MGPRPAADAGCAAMSWTSAFTSGAMAGTTIAKVEPLSGVLSAVTSPPSIRQKWLVVEGASRPPPPAVLPRGRGFCLHERLEQPGELLPSHANPGIRDLELHHVGTGLENSAGRQGDPPLLREFGSVAQQV